MSSSLFLLQSNRIKMRMKLKIKLRKKRQHQLQASLPRIQTFCMVSIIWTESFVFIFFYSVKDLSSNAEYHMRSLQRWVYKEWCLVCFRFGWQNEISKKLCCFLVSCAENVWQLQSKLRNAHTIVTLTIYSSDSQFRICIFCLLLCVETFVHFIGFLIYYRWSLSRLLFEWRTHLQLYFVKRNNNMKWTLE